MREKAKAITTRLSDKHTVKRIIVDVWKLCNIDSIAKPG